MLGSLPVDFNHLLQPDPGMVCCSVLRRSTTLLVVGGEWLIFARGPSLSALVSHFASTTALQISKSYLMPEL